MGLSSYMVGAQIVGAGTPASRALVLRVQNVPEVVKAQGGALGELAQAVLPDMVEQKFFTTMRDQLVQKMGEQGVKVAVDVVQAKDAPRPVRESDAASGWRDFGLGVGAGVVAGLIVRKVLG